MAASEIGRTRNTAVRRHKRQTHSGASVLPLAAREHQTAHVHGAPLRPVMALRETLINRRAWDLMGRPGLSGWMVDQWVLSRVNNVLAR